MDEEQKNKISMQPEVSIIIINYNTFALTCNCIASIYEKTQEISVEIILVDNKSTECNPDLFLGKFPQIKLIKSNENVGFSGGNNLGVAQAEGNVILFLNSDVVLINNAIDLAYKKLTTSPDIGVITCLLQYEDDSIQCQCRRFETISLKLVELFRIHKLLWSPQKRAVRLLSSYFNHKTEMIVDRIWGTFFMFKREVLEKLPNNKWSDKLFMYGEDDEWCYQLRRYTNYSILYYPEAKIIHFLGSSEFGRGNPPEKMKIIMQNKKMVMNEYYGVFKTKILFLIDKCKFRTGLYKYFS